MTNMTDEINPANSSEQPAPAPANSESEAKRLSPGRAFTLGVATVLALVAAVAVWFGIASVRRLSRHPAAVQFAAVLRIPVARVNGAPVLYSEYIRDIETLSSYYAGAGGGGFAPTAEQISDQVLSRLTVNALVRGLAKNYGVSIARAEADESEMLKQVLASFPNREAAGKELKDRYGWTFDQYVERVVMPILLEQKLERAFASSTDDAGKAYEEEQARTRHILFSTGGAKTDAQIRAQAERVLARLKKGEDFAKLAGEFGSDGTKNNGGDLGWFGRGQMVPEFEAVAFTLQPGELSSKLVKTQFGWHIIRLEEKRLARNYARFIDGELRRATIEILLPVHNPFIGLTADSLSATTTAVQ